MGCGIAMNKLDRGLRSLLERSGSSIGDTSNLKKEYVPLVRESELNLVRQELAGQTISIVFDGTTSCGEVLARHLYHNPICASAPTLRQAQTYQNKMN